MKVQLQVFLISTSDKPEWSASRPGHFTRGEAAPVYTERKEQWAYSRFGTSIEKRKSLTPARTQTPNRSSTS